MYSAVKLYYLQDVNLIQRMYSEYIPVYCTLYCAIEIFDVLSHFENITVCARRIDTQSKICFFLNPQFLPNHYEILSKCGTHEDLILTKFRNVWVKIVYF